MKIKMLYLFTVINKVIYISFYIFFLSPLPQCIRDLSNRAEMDNISLTMGREYIKDFPVDLSRGHM